jgi:hypothetical protein
MQRLAPVGTRRTFDPFDEGWYQNLKEGRPTKRRRNHKDVSEESQQEELEDDQALNNVAQKPFEG